MNIIQWNEMRESVMRRTREHDKEAQTENEIVSNAELETVHNHSVASIDCV